MVKGKQIWCTESHEAVERLSQKAGPGFYWEEGKGHPEGRDLSVLGNYVACKWVSTAFLGKPRKLPEKLCDPLPKAEVATREAAEKLQEAQIQGDGKCGKENNTVYRERTPSGLYGISIFC